MTKIEIEAEVFGDWAFPVGIHDAYYKNVRAGLTPQQSLFLLTLARSSETLRADHLMALVSPGARPKLAHVITMHIRKRLAEYGIEPPFENMYERHDTLGVKKRDIRRKVTSGYKWIG